jgi:hypothetical protein
MSDNKSFSAGLGSQSGLTGSLSEENSKSIACKCKYIWRKNFNAQNVFIALALMCIVVLFSYLVEPGFLVAMCLFIGIFLMPVFSQELRQDKNIVFGYWFVVFLHQIVAFTNAYLFATYGAEFDAGHFQKLSEAFALHGEFSFTIGAQLYVQILGKIYRWFGSSHLLGEQFSILAFAFSCIILLKIIRLLGIVKYKIYSLLAFGALPTMLFLGSITLRESFQILFFMLTVFCGMKMHMKDGINVYITAFLASLFFMCISHRGLIAYGVFIILLMFIWSIKPVTHLRNVKKLRLVFFVIGPIFFLGIINLLDVSNIHFIVAKLVDRNWLDVIGSIRTGPIHSPGRTTYGIPLDSSSNMMAIYSGLNLYLHYLFAPLPWQVHSLLDAYAGMESMFRMILIYFSIKHWHNSAGSQKRQIVLMLILYISITFLFAVGTANYGTALRHHMLSWWLIVIIGIPPLMEKLSCFRFRRIIFKPKKVLKSSEVIS